MNWTNRNASVQDMAMLQSRFGVDTITAKILSGRGVTDPDQVKFFLENDVSFLHNPFEFEDMGMFCERILQAVEDHEKVVVFGDRDVDGITSTALMVMELKRMGLEVSYRVPMGDEPYGVTRKAVDEALSEGVTLAVTVDCGISCIDEVEYASQKGMDFLITDHHLEGQGLPAAVAIIDPKVEGSGYPFRDLAGCGVVLKCIWALRFAQSSLYDSPVMLLHALPGNDTVIIEAARIENMMVVDRISEEVVPGILPLETSRLMKFLSCGLPILVLDSETELKLMRKAFSKAEIHLVDLRTEFEKYLPIVRNSTLFDLSYKSRFALYASYRSELDTLIGLYGAYVRLSNPLLYKQYITLTDLAAIGTISDLMPMTDENRIIIRCGLRQLEKGSRESLLPFMAMQNLLSRRLGTTDVSWNMSPLLNASGRLGKPDVAIEMIMSTDQSKAYEYSSQLNELNKTRQKLGEDAWNRLLKPATDFYEASGSKMVLVYDSRMPRGITGNIATRLQKVFKVPSVVITTTEDGRDIGSVRSPESFNCHQFLSSYSELFSDFGGHDCAGGFTLKPDCRDEFMARVSENVDFMDCLDEEPSEIVCDAVLSESEFTTDLIKVVERFEPYGEQNDALVFRINNARIEKITSMNNSKDAANNHLRLLLSYGTYKWPALFWSAGNRVGKDFSEGEIADVVFRMGRNYFKNQESIQLTVLDIKRS